jgi:hypothetical protein
MSVWCDRVPLSVIIGAWDLGQASVRVLPGQLGGSRAVGLYRSFPVKRAIWLLDRVELSTTPSYGLPGTVVVKQTMQGKKSVNKACHLILGEYRPAS